MRPNFLSLDITVYRRTDSQYEQLISVDIRRQKFNFHPKNPIQSCGERNQVLSSQFQAFSAVSSDIDNIAKIHNTIINFKGDVRSCANIFELSPPTPNMCTLHNKSTRHTNEIAHREVWLNRRWTSFLLNLGLIIHICEMDIKMHYCSGIS
jgi:hypothetical protein